MRKQPVIQRVAPDDPSGVGEMFRVPGKQNLHIARAKQQAREATMAKDDDKKAPQTFSVAEADELTPPHLQDNPKGVEKMRFGVTADEGPIPTVTQAGKDAITTARDDEKEQANLLYDRSTWTQV